MFRFLRKHRTIAMVSLVLCIIGVVLFQAGGSSMVSSPFDSIMKVNGAKITQAQYDRLYNQAIHSQKAATLTPEQRQQLQSQTLQELIRQEVFVQEAKKYGITVTDQEMQMQLLMIPAFQKDGKFDGPTYVQVVRQMFGISPQEFEKGHRRDIAIRNMNLLLASSVHISDAQLAAVLPMRIQMETDPAKKKDLQKNPELVRQELREKELNFVYGDWMNQLNATLKVTPLSAAMQKRLAGPAQ